MLPIFRSIPSRRAISQPILQKTIAGPPLEHPIEIRIVRDGIACLVRGVAVGIVLIAMIDAILERIFGDRVQ